MSVMVESAAAHQMSATPLSLSVVVVALCGQEYLPRCLRALQEQAEGPPEEIIVVCDERMGDMSPLRDEFPTVRFNHVPERRTTDELRALGVRQAKGSLVALTEDHCTPDRNWCKRTLEAHRSPHAAIGGAVEKQPGPDAVLNWAVYFFDLGHYQNPVPLGLARNLSDCNVSYKGKSLAKVAHLWGRAFHVTAVNWALQASGETVWLSPDIVVWHQRGFQFDGVLCEVVTWGRSFAGTRVAKLSWGKRLLFAGFAPLLPLVLLGRITTDRMWKRHNLGVFLLALPQILVFTFAWSWGEFIGYLTGRATIAPKSIS